MNNIEYQSPLPRRIHRHYTSIKSNNSRHRKTLVTSFENIPDEIPSNRRRIKQYRNEFIRKWTDDARQTYTQTHIIPSPPPPSSTTSSSNQMAQINLKKMKRHRAKSTSHLSSSKQLCQSKTSNSISISSIIENPKNENSSSNNSAIVYLQSDKPNDDIECKIS